MKSCYYKNCIAAALICFAALSFTLPQNTDAGNVGKRSVNQKFTLKDSDLPRLVASANEIYGKPGQVRVALQFAMDEPGGKSTRMTIYQDGNLTETPFTIYSMELVKGNGENKEYSVTLRDENTSKKCDMIVTTSAQECQINWQPNQSEGCEAYRWGFNPGITVFRKFDK